MPGMFEAPTLDENYAALVRRASSDGEERAALDAVRSQSNSPIGVRARSVGTRRRWSCNLLLLFVLFVAAAATAQTAAEAARFRQAGVCARCHVGAVLEWSTSKHTTAGVDCKGCHGPSEGRVVRWRNPVLPRTDCRNTPRLPACAPPVTTKAARRPSGKTIARAAITFTHCSTRRRTSNSAHRKCLRSSGRAISSRRWRTAKSWPGKAIGPAHRRDSKQGE